MNKKKVICYETMICFESVSLCAKYYNMNQAAMSERIRFQDPVYDEKGRELHIISYKDYLENRSYYDEKYLRKKEESNKRTMDRI